MRAETWLGAAAWAPGSQKWSGTRPAFRPKPRNASAKAQVARGAAPSRRTIAANSKEPAMRPSTAKRAKRARFPTWAAAR